MKALVLEEYGRFTYKDVPDPICGEGEVVIDIKAVSICGSDVHGYDGSSGRRQPPLIMGHEASGVISAVGGKVRKFSVGDRVAFNSALYCRDCWHCRRGMYNLCAEGRVFGVACGDYRLEGAMCEKVSVPEYILYRLPDSIDFVSAALVEPVSIALHAIDGAVLSVNDTVAIFGAGTIGLMLLKVLKHSSAGRVISVDLDPDKMELARRNGADLVVDGREDVPTLIREYTGGLGADLAFEAVGIPATINNALSSLRKGGTLVQLGNVRPVVEFPLQRIVIYELKILGRYATSVEYAKAIDMMAAGKISVGDCISKVAPLKDGQLWFDKLRAMEKGLVKVVLVS